MLNIKTDIDSLLSDWLDSGRRSSPHTAEAYRRDVQAFLQFAGLADPAQATIAHIARYQSHLRHSCEASTESRKLASLRSFFGYLKTLQIVADNPAEAISSPRVEAKFKEKLLSEDDLKRLLSAAESNPVDSLLVRLLYVTAGRVSEILSLTWGRFTERDDGGARLRILGKGRRNREVYIPPALWSSLLAARGEATETTALFDLNRFQVWQIIKRLARAAQITGEVSPHWFRHAHASHALERGASLAQVRDQLGHADIKTTSIYLHPDAESSTTKFLAIS